MIQRIGLSPGNWCYRADRHCIVSVGRPVAGHPDVWSRQPRRARFAQRRVATTDHRLPVRNHGRADCAFPGGERKRAHINPAVTMGFWLMGKLESRIAIGYVLGQLAGAVIGALPLLAWGSMGRSVAFGATLPGQGYTIQAVLLGEVATTFIMVSLLAVFLGFRRIRPFTPAIFPFLYAVMVYAESPISGTSTNPARSLGPAIISGQWQGGWIYWVGPLIGAYAATLVCGFLAKRIEVAKIYHFESDRRRIFRTGIGFHGTSDPRQQGSDTLE